MENFYTLLTNTGINAIIAARAINSEVKLTKIAVGDGDIIPSQDMTALKSEKHRFNINSIIQDIDNPNYLIVEGVIPSNIGGFYVSEVAIYTDQNTLFAIGSLPKTYKPLLEEGSAKDLTIKIFLEVTNADSVTLKVDDSVVLATRKFVLSELKKYALINGNETKRFKVADAVELNEAINKKQLDDAMNSLNKEISITGSATFNGATQTIDLIGIGNITLAIGDVIEVTGTTSNNKLFTVESIPNDNQIIVNYEHRGTSTPAPKGRLVNETTTATIKLYNRAKDAPLGQGQYLCTPASGRAQGPTYTNLTNREIEISVAGVIQITSSDLVLRINGIDSLKSNVGSRSGWVGKTISPLNQYLITTTTGVLDNVVWQEKR